MIAHNAAQNSSSAGGHDIYLPGNRKQKNEMAIYFVHM